MSEGILVKQILKIFGASRLIILNLSYKKTAKNEDSKKKMKNIWWTMKKNTWKKDAHPGENGESNADKHENRWWRVMKRISLIQDAEEINDNAE